MPIEPTDREERKDKKLYCLKIWDLKNVEECDDSEWGIRNK